MSEVISASDRVTEAIGFLIEQGRPLMFLLRVTVRFGVDINISLQPT
jgi:hypothetical protein